MAAITDIPVEIIIQMILILLPVKSLCCLSSVCRHLRSIIRSRNFISYHFNLQQTKTLFRCYLANRDQFWLLDVTENKPFTVNSWTRLNFPFFSQYQFWFIVGSCRGIVCLADVAMADPEQPIFLWNPYIRQHRRLPVATLGQSDEPHSFALGFGYSGVDDVDFKVVRFVTYAGSVPRAEVYTVKRPEWRHIVVNDIRLQDVRLAWSPVFLHGAVHWLACSSQNDSYRMSILRFWVAREVFDEMLLPNELEFEYYMNLSLSLRGESLVLINYNIPILFAIFEVWLMERYDDDLSWNKLYTCESAVVNPRVVALRQNNEALVAHELFGLVTLDLENGHKTDLRILGARDSFYVAEYVESIETLSRD